MSTEEDRQAMTDNGDCIFCGDPMDEHSDDDLADCIDDMRHEP